jgi:hypothetical protein
MFGIFCSELSCGNNCAEQKKGPLIRMRKAHQADVTWIKVDTLARRTKVDSPTAVNFRPIGTSVRSQFWPII